MLRGTKRQVVVLNDIVFLAIAQAFLASTRVASRGSHSIHDFNRAKQGKSTHYL